MRPSDVPTGVPTVPHECGVGVKVDIAAFETKRFAFTCYEAEVLSEIYSLLRLGNGGGGMGPSGITWTTIDSYQRALSVRLDMWTLNLLFMVDGIYLKAVAARMEKERKKQPAPTAS